MLDSIQQLLVAQMPRALKQLAKLTPRAVQLKVLNLAFNQAFKEELAEGDFDFLDQRRVKLEISDLDVAWDLTLNGEQLCVSACQPDYDLRFAGEWNQFVLLAGRKVDPDTLFFQRRLSIEGDTELGMEIKNLLDNLELERLPGLLRQGLDHSASLIEQYQTS